MLLLTVWSCSSCPGAHTPAGPCARPPCPLPRARGTAVSVGQPASKSFSDHGGVGKGWAVGEPRHATPELSSGGSREGRDWGSVAGELRGLQPASVWALDPGKGLTLSVLTCRSGTLWPTSPRPVAPATDCPAHGWGANATPGFCTGTIGGLGAREDEQPPGPDTPLPCPLRSAGWKAGCAPFRAAGNSQEQPSRPRGACPPALGLRPAQNIEGTEVSAGS